MAIAVKCLRCRSELEGPGGLLFGPPDYKGKTTKDHLCAVCFVIVHQGIVAVGGNA